MERWKSETYCSDGRTKKSTLKRGVGAVERVGSDGYERCLDTGLIIETSSEREVGGGEGKLAHRTE